MGAITQGFELSDSEEPKQKQETFLPVDNDPWVNVYTPNFDNRPTKKDAVLLLNEVSVLSFQNLSSIIAKPGAGKSSTKEAIVSAFINPKSDNLGFTVNADAVIWIDFERTDIDVHESFMRIARRTGITRDTDLSKVKIHGFRMVEKIEERKKLIIEALTDTENTLLLLDGCGDLVNDTNDLAKAIEFKSWCRMITGIYKCSIFTSLHPNKGTLTPRGHIGSEVMRESESVICIDFADDEKRIITSDFAMGKTRNSSGIKGCFAWDDDKKMMVTAEVEDEPKLKLSSAENSMNEEEIILMLKETNSIPMNATDTISKLKDYINKKVPGVKKDTNSIKRLKKYLEFENYLIIDGTKKDAKRRLLVINPQYL